MKSHSPEARAYLAKKVSEVTGQPVDPNKVKISEGVYYTRKTIGTSTAITRLIESGDDLSAGTTNFQNAKTAEGNHLAVTEVRLASMANGSILGDVYSNYLSDKGVQMGDIKVYQNGKELLSAPATLFNREAKTAGFEFREITPFFIQAGIPVEATFETKVASAANTNIELVFKGAQTTAR